MPKSKRDLIKRKVGYVLGNLDRAMEFTLEVRTLFLERSGVDPDSETLLEDLREAAKENTHARIAFYLSTALQTTLMAEQFVKKAAMDAWGNVPANIEQWRNTPKDIHRQKREV